eukprot:9962748-Alexandrium_andersonii.AAC.1
MAAVKFDVVTLENSKLFPEALFVNEMAGHSHCVAILFGAEDRHLFCLLRVISMHVGAWGRGCASGEER